MKAKEKKSKGAEPTRERILNGVLKLFNENGEGSVTTANIAEYLGISEGNLWYHFRTKRDLVFELSCRLEAEIDQNLSRVPEENLDLKDFMRYAARAFEYLWEYRFLFRDRYNPGKNEDDSARLQELTVRGQLNIERILGDMRRRKMLALSTEEVRALAINAWIIHSNWLRFLQMRETVREITENHIKEGFAQLIWLFNPYLSEEGKREAALFINEFSLKKLNAETTEKS